MDSFEVDCDNSIQASMHDSPSDNTPKSSGGGNSNSNGGPALNPRSCITCRRRKVRCNKQYPCSNCAKAKIQCIFPAPERAKRRPRKPPDGELLARLRRLEGVIQGMGMSVEDELAASDKGNNQSSEQLPLPQHSSQATPTETTTPSQTQTNTMTSDFGRLVVNEGKSRYLNNRFWSSLSNEIQDLKGLLDESSDEEADHSSPSTDYLSPGPDAAFYFNYSLTGRVGWKGENENGGRVEA